MLRICLFTMFAVFAFASFGASAISSHAQKRYVALDLLSDYAIVTPGQTITVALRQRIDPNWHTYWVNPGDSGQPTVIEWNLPRGVTAGNIQWPLPKPIPIGPLTNYGYENEVLLLSEIKLPDALPPGDLVLAAKVRYLACKEICVPGEGDVRLTLRGGQQRELSPGSSTLVGESDVRLTLRGGQQRELSPAASIIAEARQRIPTALPGTAVFAIDPAKSAIALKVTLAPGVLANARDARFFPLSWGVINNAAKQPNRIANNVLHLQMQQGDSNEQPLIFDGLLTLTKADRTRVGFMVFATRGDVTGD